MPILWKITPFLGDCTPLMKFFLTFLYKRHLLAPDRIVWAINDDDRTIRLGCARAWEKKDKSTKKVTKSWQTTPPPSRSRWRDINQTWHIRWSLGGNHACQIWSWSVGWFLFWRGPKFTLSHRKATPPIQHCHALTRWHVKSLPV
jgi:hypothetical protein